MKSKKGMLKSQRHIDSEGYIVVKTQRGWVREHRIIIENMLGHRLSPTELVHHKNKERTDNRPENLELTNKREHCHIYHTGINHKNWKGGWRGYRERHKEKINAYQGEWRRKWRKENPEKIKDFNAQRREYMKKHRKEHKEEFNLKRKIWRTMRKAKGLPVT